MGCYESSSKKCVSFEEHIGHKIMEAIDFNTVSTLRKIIHMSMNLSKNAELLNQKILIYKDFPMCPLAFSLIKGKSSSFSYLISEGASYEVMETFFQENNMHPIEIIFTRNYADFLDTFLPYYKENKEKSNSYSFNPSCTPMHIATRMGMLGVISKIFKIYKGQTKPLEFSLDTLDKNGENCGMIACRHGKPYLLRHFYEDCNVDFSLLNHKGENAIMLCLIGYQFSRHYNHYECIVYLVETVKIDITYRWEEMLGLATFNFDTLSYLKKALGNVPATLSVVALSASCQDDNSDMPEYSEVYKKLFLNDERLSIESKG